MCNLECLEFAKKHLTREVVHGKRLLDVGGRNVNGSAKVQAMYHEPAEYLSIDIQSGRDVDQVIDANELLPVFGRNSFDVVITTEMYEHVEDWKNITRNIKGVLKPGGYLLLTTRSPGFPLHNYPGDHWRYTVDDMRFIFSDFEDIVVEDDPFEPGVFFFGRKPENFIEVDLSHYNVSPVIWNVL